MKRALDWPRYMKQKRLAGSAIAYYWEPPDYAKKGGFTLHGEPLGQVYSAARDRAMVLNEHLDAWRACRNGEVIEPPAKTGTVDWWIEEFFRLKQKRKKLGPRTLSDYRKALDRLAGLRTETGIRVGELPVSSLSPGAVDKIYDRLRDGGRITRQANMVIDVARTAWKRSARAHPGVFMVPVAAAGGVRLAPINPFADVERVVGDDTATPATRVESLALSKALVELGHPQLALVPLIAFEWQQRPTNIIAGHITWSDYRPTEKPDQVRVFHHKTGERVWRHLEDIVEGGNRMRFYPELEEMLAASPRLGVPIVMFRPQRAPKGRDGLRVPKVYSYTYAEHLVQRARALAKLPTHVTMEACRHGGMTELGDAELTESEVMALSGHKTPQAARLYIKKTERQRLSAARKRRAHVLSERNG